MSPRTVPAGTPLGDDFHVFDTTLRDGAQREGISYSVADKLAVARLLDELGVGFIEGGWPGAHAQGHRVLRPRRAGELTLRHAALVAFGATRKAGRRGRGRPAGPRAARRAGPGRHPGRQVRRPARRAGAAHRRRGEPARWSPTPSRSCVARGPAGLPRLRALLRRLPVRPRLRRCGCSRRRVAAGADVVVLCDTNGGMLPLGIAEVVDEVRDRTGFRLGIHCQDDTGCAVANTVAAVEAGATHVQCTANGYGERAGNADLFAVVGNLVTKLGHAGAARGRLAELMRVSHAIAEIANIAPDTHQAYVGVVGVRAQGGPARERDQGRPGALQPHGPRGRRQRHADPGHRDGRPGQRRAQGPRARPGPGRPSRRRGRAWSTRSRSWRRRAGRSRRPTRRSSCCVRSALSCRRRRRRARRSRWSRTG